MNPIFLEEGEGPHFSQQSKPFPRPDKKSSQQRGRSPGSREPEPRPSVCCSRFMKMHKGQSFLLHLNRSSRKGFVTTPIKKERKNGGLFFSVEVCPFLPGCSP